MTVQFLHVLLAMRSSTMCRLMRVSCKSNCRPGKLLKFDIGQGGIQMHDGHPIGADLKFVGAANQRRGRADTCSKVIIMVNENIIMVNEKQLKSVAGLWLCEWHCVTVSG